METVELPPSESPGPYTLQLERADDDCADISVIWRGHGVLARRWHKWRRVSIPVLVALIILGFPLILTNTYVGVAEVDPGMVGCGVSPFPPQRKETNIRCQTACTWRRGIRTVWSA